MVNRVFLGIGSNLGEREKNIRDAVTKLSDDENVAVQSTSSLYETEPYGNVEQQNFYNIVLETKVELSPKELYYKAKAIEQKLGRQKSERWGPRLIDIDILLFDDQIIDDADITIPHKDMLNRDFVMIPLAEISPDTIHPVANKKVKDLISGNLVNTIISKREFRL